MQPFQLYRSRSGLTGCGVRLPGKPENEGALLL